MIDRRVPDYGLHWVLRVLLCAINGGRDLVVQCTGKALATVARTMLQPVPDDARLAARTCTRASFNNDKANSKEMVRVECTAAMHFMRNRGWQKVIDACLQHPSVRQHHVGGTNGEWVCNMCWENFVLHLFGGRKFCNREHWLLLPPRCGLHLLAQDPLWSFNTFLNALEVGR